MDKISEFFKELKDRFSNPLIFSFLFGWLVVNWKIVIGLTCYSITDLSRDGYTSYINLITSNSNFENSFLFPFLIALGYTFLFPVFRNLISMFNAWIQRWGSVQTLRISKEGKISVAKYIKLREIIEERRHAIENVINQESQHLIEKERLSTENMKIQTELNGYKTDLQVINDNNNRDKTFNGDWIIKTKDSLDRLRVVISKGIIFVNNSYEKGDQLYQISGHSYNSYTQEFVVVFQELRNGTVRGEFVEIFSTDNGRPSLLKNRSNKGRIMEMIRDDIP